MNLELDEDINTVYKLLKKLEKNEPNKPFLGTKVKDGDKVYWNWVTVGDMAKQAKHLASGMMSLGLLPEREADGRKWRFVAIQAKNRVEWTVTHLANMNCKTTTVGLHDTLSDKETRYIVAQTELATICCSGPNVERHIRLKMMDDDVPEKDRKYNLVRNLVVFDQEIMNNQDILEKAKKAGLSVYTYD